MDQNIVLSVFQLENDRGYYCPSLTTQFADPQSTSRWFIRAGGTRCYVVRTRPLNEGVGIDEEMDAPLSHFMASRVIGALFMARCGLFRAINRGRVSFPAHIPFTWQTHLFDEDYSSAVDRIHAEANPIIFQGWLTASCTSTFVRRAIDDAILAIRNPTESFVFLHRGFEWLEDGLKISKKQLADAIGVTLREYKSVGRIANDGTGVRHASATGLKVSADLETYATWAVGLVECIDFARATIDSQYTRMSRDDCMKVVRLGIDSNPYP